MENPLNRSSWIALISALIWLWILTIGLAIEWGKTIELKKRAIVRTVDINAFDKEIRKLGYKVSYLKENLDPNTDPKYKELRDKRLIWTERGWLKK